VAGLIWEGDGTLSALKGRGWEGQWKLRATEVPRELFRWVWGGKAETSGKF